MPQLNQNEFSSFTFESEEEARAATTLSPLNRCFIQNLLYSAVTDKLAFNPMDDKRELREAHTDGKIEILKFILEVSQPQEEIY